MAQGKQETAVKPVRTKKTIVINVTRPSALRLPNRKDFREPHLRGGVRLLPGENDVNADYWDSVKTNGTVKKWLAVGLIENKGKGKAQPITESLASVKVENFGKYLKAEASVPTLMKYRDHDELVTAKKAIADRIKEIVDSQDGEAAE